MLNFLLDKNGHVSSLKYAMDIDGEQWMEHKIQDNMFHIPLLNEY
ncbi:Imm64 family immunity protein [Robertmurraya massiliosenegalensis]